MPLTDVAIRNAKPEPGKAQSKKSDGGGLFLLVRANGSKLWQMDYRFGGLRKTLSFGPYPEVSLAQAREQRENAKRLLRDNIDPSVKKREDRVTLATEQRNTFGAVVEDYLRKLEAEGRSPATMAKNRWLLEDLAKGLAKRPIRDIKSTEILSILEHVERSGRRESAHRLRGAIGTVFRWAISKLRADTDPTYALRGSLMKVDVTPRPAIIDPKQFGRLLAMIDEYDGWPTVKAALKIQALCFARPYETRTMEWTELDLDAARWTIPATKMKMRVVHDVPLSRQAVAALRDIQQLSGKGRLVFPSIRNPERPLSENAMNAGLRRMGVGQSEHCAHGFRSSASTILNSTGRFHQDWIETQLSHLDANEVRRIYNRALYWPQRVDMMQAWADICCKMKTF